MREIKFRAMELDTGRLVYGYYVAEHGYYMNNDVPDLNKPVVRHYIIGDGGKHDICEETVCQYTGLKDKIGAELYHNDIYRHWGRVITCDFECAIFEQMECTLFDGDFEIIGNIYENPELLEQSK